MNRLVLAGISIGALVSGTQLCAAPAPVLEAPNPPTVLPSRHDSSVRAVEVILNAQNLGTWEVLDHQGGHWVDAAALQAWRLLMPSPTQPLWWERRLWWPLHAMPGFSARWDAAKQSLEIAVLPGSFAPTVLGAALPPRPVPSPVIPAFFVNYDAAWTETRLAGSATSDRGLVMELGFTSAAGVLLSTHALRSVRWSEGPSPSQGRRLETHWTREWPDQGLMLRAGDAWTHPSTWGRQTAFAGLQLSNHRWYGAMGGAAASPLLTGTAVTPSTVELYINESLRQSVQVPAGPFTLEPSTPVAGTAQARLVVRDVLGRETVIVRPFVSSPDLLAPGRIEWSLEMGKVRRGLGFTSIDDGYGAAFAQAWIRRGMDRRLTLESRLQATSEFKQFGAGAAMALLDRGVLQLAASASAAGDLKGLSAMAGLQSQGLRHGLSLRVAGSGRDYRELGQWPGWQPSRLEGSAAWRMGWGEGLGFGVTLAVLRRHDQSSVQTGSVSFSQRLSSWGSLVWSASRLQTTNASAADGAPLPRGSSGTSRSTNLQLLAVIPLQPRGSGGRPTATAQMQHRQGADGASTWDAIVTAQAPLAADSGWGWRALAGRRNGASVVEAGWQRLSPQSLLGLEVSGTDGGPHALRGNIQGAWVLTQAGLQATRRLQESFAVIEVPGLPDVGVALDGPVMARTDARGIALLPRLSPHRVNRIRLNPNDLPPESEIDNIELGAVPPWRSAVRVRFPVREGRAALLGFLVAGDSPAPRGASVMLEGDAREFQIGGRGQAYVTGLPPDEPRRVTLSWKGQQCVVEVVWRRPAGELRPSQDLMRLGPWHCPEVQP